MKKHNSLREAVLETANNLIGPPNIINKDKLFKEAKTDIKSKLIHGVQIGDEFIYQKRIKCTVVDFYEQISVQTGEFIKHLCIAKCNDLSTNLFEVPFAMVIRNKINV